MTIGAAVTFVLAVVFALVVRGPGVIGIALLFILFVPLERAFPLRPQKILRRGLVTDVTQLFVNGVFVTIGAIGLAS
jgi:hypothetical protein